jgi:hypothetical protein
LPGTERISSASCCVCRAENWRSVAAAKDSMRGARTLLLPLLLLVLLLPFPRFFCALDGPYRSGVLLLRRLMLE